MKLRPAEIFGENAVLQRGKDIPVWGSSAEGDCITITLGDQTREAVCKNGSWRVNFDPLEAQTGLAMTIASELTGETLRFTNLAVGEVWICGGQSNMEFLLKYDIELPELLFAEEDPMLRYFCAPQRNFEGVDATTDFSGFGFWRSFQGGKENRSMIAAVPYYMAQMLREKLQVPIGMIGCNWGGTPAAAWASLEEIKATPAMKPILDWQEKILKELDWQSYYEASEQKVAPLSPEAAKGQEDWMMGIGLKEFFEQMAKNPPMQLPVYSPYVPGPRACIRPAGLYDTMLTKIAPYALRGAIWYQGEDDDMREWNAFYDESMKAVIRSWRRLWKEEFPFYQVELAPFGGRSHTAAKNYPLIREMAHRAAAEMEGTKNICIMDLGDDLNIHFRNKRLVGERLALLAEKYVYGMEVQADSPELCGAVREGSRVRLSFTETAGKLVVEEGSFVDADGRSADPFVILADGQPVEAQISAEGDILAIEAPAFAAAEEICITYAKKNYCHGNLFGGSGLPVFPFAVKL